MTNLELTLCEQILNLASSVNDSNGSRDVWKKLDNAALIARRAVASDKFKYGWKHNESFTGSGDKTAGYGFEYESGYFQYPLSVNQETKEVGGWL